MSYPRDCNGCARGHHEDHDPAEGRIPGLIGGYTCPCTGDCAARFAEFCDRMAEVLLEIANGELA